MKDKLKQIINDIYIPHKKLDFFVYLMLILFIIIVMVTKANMILTIIYAICFVTIILFLYIFKIQILDKFDKKKNLNKLKNLTNSDLKEIMINFYKTKDYKVTDGRTNSFSIQKNNNTYIVLLILNKNVLEAILKTINKKNYYIIITNQDFTKEERKIIKEKKIYTISKYGLLNILEENEKSNNTNFKNTKKEGEKGK